MSTIERFYGDRFTCPDGKMWIKDRATGAIREHVGGFELQVAIREENGTVRVVDVAQGNLSVAELTECGVSVIDRTQSDSPLQYQCSPSL